MDKSYEVESFSVPFSNDEATVAAKILRLVCYFDIFNYPLTKKEVINYSACSGKEIDSCLEQLKDEKIIFYENNFYFLPGRTGIIRKRIEDNARARMFYSRLPVWVRLISRFPYVRTICISGSLSKGVMPADGDIDYFLITKPGRLWICRTSLILFKKIFLLNSKKYFCVNYFLDSENPEVPDKNIFTATEIIHLVPVYGEKYYHEFMKANEWAKEYFPGFRHSVRQKIVNRITYLQQLSEFFMNGKTGDKLDTYLMQVTLKRWKKKFPHFNAEEFEVALRTRKNVSKHHPNRFQQKVLREYSERLTQLELATGIKLL